MPAPARSLLAVVVASVLLGTLATSPADAQGLRCRSWRIAPTHKLPSGSYFESVSGASSEDVWGVGGAEGSNLIAHWDGTAWEPVESNDPNTNLYDVVALSPNNAWVAGAYGDPQGRFVNARVLHWDGVAWSPFPAPKGGSYAFLYSVSATSASDVWAVGWGQDDQGVSRPLALHFDGTRWTRVDTGDSEGHFVGVAAIATDDVRAVGYYSPQFNEFQPLIEHWDGTVWTVVPAPSLEGDTNLLYDVSGSTSGDVWAVGPVESVSPPIALHWNGAIWSVATLAPRPGRLFTFNGVVAISPNDVWVAGVTTDENYMDRRPAAEHWDGTAWTITPMRSPGTFGDLRGVDATSSTDVWTAGFFYDGSSISHPLAEHSKGPCGE